MKTLLKVLAVLAVLLIGAFVVFLFTDWEAPVLGQKLVAIAAEAAGIELQADRVVINLRKGLLLEGVVATSYADGESMTATAELLQVDCALIPLIRGNIIVRRILLQSPRIEVVSRDLNGNVATASPEKSTAATVDSVGRPAAAEEASIEGRPKPVTIDELTIRDAYLISRTEGSSSTMTVIEDLDFELFDFEVDDSAASAALGVVGRGHLSATGIQLDERAVSDLVADLEVNRGRYLLANVEAVAGGSGEIEIERVELDMGQDPYRYRVAASIREFDMNALWEDVDASGLGPASLDLEANGEGPGLSGAVAELVIQLGAGRLPSVEILETLDDFLGTSLDAAPYEATEIRLSLVDGLLEVEPFDLVSGIARLGVGGTVELEGEIDLKVPVGLPRDAFQRGDVSEEVLDSLTSRDWLTIPLAVSGTVDDPTFGPDMDVVRDLTRRVADSARDAARSRIRSELEGVISGRFSASDSYPE